MVVCNEAAVLVCRDRDSTPQDAIVVQTCPNCGRPVKIIAPVIGVGTLARLAKGRVVIPEHPASSFMYLQEF
jgi:hypothetical protein